MRDTSKPIYLGRNRVDDSPELFEKRYSDYEQRNHRMVELHRESSVKVRFPERQNTALHTYSTFQARSGCKSNYGGDIHSLA